MLNPFKSLGYIKRPIYPVALDLLKDLEILLEITVKGLAVDREDVKPYWKSEKGHICIGDQRSYYLQVFQKLY